MSVMKKYSSLLLQTKCLRFQTDCRSCKVQHSVKPCAHDRRGGRQRLFTSVKTDLVATLAPYTLPKRKVSCLSGAWSLTYSTHFVMFSGPWKPIPCCRMCHQPEWSKPPGFCSLCILFKEAYRIRAGLRSGNLPSQSFHRRKFTCHKIKISHLIK